MILFKCSSELIRLTRIISVELQYLKSFNYVQSINNNTWNHLTDYKQMNSGSFKNNVTYKLFTYKSHTHTHTHTHIYIYIYIKDLPLNLQGLHKPTKFFFFIPISLSWNTTNFKHYLIISMFLSSISVNCHNVNT